MAKKKTPGSALPAEVQVVMAGFNKEYGDGTLMLVGEHNMAGRVRTLHSTGSISLDIAIGLIRISQAAGREGILECGLPGGRIVECYGKESSGKTTLLNHLIASAQGVGGLCGLIDMEQTWDRDYATKLGVDVESLVFAQPGCAEEALDIAEALVKTRQFAVLGVDSIAALVPKAELEGGSGDSHMGLQARLMSQFFRKINPILSGDLCDTLLFMTNQIREKVGVLYGSPEVTCGGNAMKFYASIRLDISRNAPLKSQTGEIIGNRTKVKVIKNKLAPPFRTAEFDIVYGKGVDKITDLIDTAAMHDILTLKGSWYSYKSENIGQGMGATARFLDEHKDIAEQVMKDLVAKLTGVAA
jgi:recombination protein RecA